MNEVTFAIHTRCGGSCDDADGYWWCYKCQDYIEDNEVEESVEEERGIKDGKSDGELCCLCEFEILDLED